MILSLLETGNTIDGVIIASLLLEKENHLQQTNNFKSFFEWKNRKCHSCMEYIIDAGKAITCINLIKNTKPCKNLFCQKCVNNFFERKQNEEMQYCNVKNAHAIQQSKLSHHEQLVNLRLKRTKTWFKGFQNVLFMCPCCLNLCKNNPFFINSVCNTIPKIQMEPMTFIDKKIYIYQSQRITESLPATVDSHPDKFVLAKITGANR